MSRWALAVALVVVGLGGYVLGERSRDDAQAADQLTTLKRDVAKLKSQMALVRRAGAAQATQINRLTLQMPLGVEAEVSTAMGVAKDVGGGLASGTATASCPPGTEASGGGVLWAYPSYTSDVINWSTPSAGGLGWSVGVSGGPQRAGATFTVYAVCVDLWSALKPAG